MTAEEALYELKRKRPAKVFRTELYCKAYDIAIKALEEKIEALEKQTPKKVIYKDNYPHCPRCNLWLVRQHEYCFACGQKLDFLVL